MSKSSEHICIEMFPAKAKKKSGSAGQNIKLPCGMHVSTGKISYFLDECGEKVADLGPFLDTIAKYSMENIQRIISANLVNNQISEGVKDLEIVIDYEQIGRLADNVRIVLDNCRLMSYLVNKAMKTGYLTHYERLSILNVFGHVGETGKEFVHTVMRFTMNYQFNITQRFIERLPGKPISHTLSEQKKAQVYDELNVHVRAQELATRIVELRKQKRGIDKSIRKIESDLCVVFDNAGVDCMEIDMGLLVRRPKEDSYEWVVEI